MGSCRWYVWMVSLCRASSAPVAVRGTPAVPSIFPESPDRRDRLPGDSPLCRSSLSSRVLQLDAQPAWSEAVACCLTADACGLLVTHLALQSTAASAERGVPIVSTSLVAAVDHRCLCSRLMIRLQSLSRSLTQSASISMKGHACWETAIGHLPLISSVVPSANRTADPRV